MLMRTRILFIIILLILLALTKPVLAEDEHEGIIHIEDDEMRILVKLNKACYSPGEKIRADFYITNKKDTVVREINIKLVAYYLGKKVFTYSHPSWREYKKNQEVHIYYESRIPSLALPGKYDLKFYFEPEGQSIKSGEITIEIIATQEWYVFASLVLLFLFVLLSAIIAYRKKIKEYYLGLSVGQRFVFLAILFLILAAFILAGGAENFANHMAIITYFCLVVGVLNLLIEETKLVKEIDSKTREGICFLAVGSLLYLSGDILVLVSLPFIVLGTVIVTRKFTLAQIEQARGYYTKLAVFQKLSVISLIFVLISLILLLIGYESLAKDFVAITYIALITSIANLIYEKKSNFKEKDREIISIVLIGALSYILIGEFSLWISIIFAAIGVFLILKRS